MRSLILQKKKSKMGYNFLNYQYMDPRFSHKQKNTREHNMNIYADIIYYLRRTKVFF